MGSLPQHRCWGSNGDVFCTEKEGPECNHLLPRIEDDGCEEQDGHYVDNMTTERRKNVIKFATTHGRRQRQQKRSKQSVLRAEMMKRITAKKEHKAAKERKQLERELKTGHVQDIIDRFSLDAHRQDDLDGKLTLVMLKQAQHGIPCNKRTKGKRQLIFTALLTQPESAEILVLQRCYSKHTSSMVSVRRQVQHCRTAFKETVKLHPALRKEREGHTKTKRQLL